MADLWCDLRVRLPVFVAVGIAALLAVVGGQQPGPALVLPNVALIDGTGTPSRAPTTIVVRDGRIADIFPTGDRPVPAGARVLATDGRYVIPGLIDTHVHLAGIDRPRPLVESLLRATLLGGVTTVRDMGGNGAAVAALQHAAASGAVSPDIRMAAVFAGPEAFWFTDAARTGFLHDNERPGTVPWLVKVEPGLDIRAAVRRARDWGASGIKLYSHLTPRQVRQIVDEARRVQLPVWARSTINPATPGDAVDARAATLSHADWLVWQGRTGVYPPLFASPAGMMDAMNVVAPSDTAIGRLFDRMADRRVALEPVLYVAVQAASFATEERPRLDRQIAWAAEASALARTRGVPVITGTDAIGGSSPNLHVELQLLVHRAGFTPLQALRAATVDAAQAIGLGQETGRIAVGRRADLVVLARNPAEDIRNTQTVLMVLRNGVVLERTDPMPVPPLGEAPGR